MDPIADLADLASTRVATSTDEERKNWGQYFTPAAVARFMARLCLPGDRPEVRILDPGAGFGILGLSLAFDLLQADLFRKVTLVAVEAEPKARDGLRQILTSASKVIGPRLTVEVVERDFLDVKPGEMPPFDIAISNPPYFKMSPKKDKGGTAPNSYARFMDVSLGLLRPGGTLCFIVPRSFASGYYFRAFRRHLHEVAALEYVHVFESRRDVFADQEVLQENVIIRYRKGPAVSPDVLISAGDYGDLNDAHPLRIARDEVLRPADKDGIVCLPTSGDDQALLKAVRRWPCTLASYGLDISTGPVVPFRSEDVIKGTASATTVPLLWMNHVRVGEVRWPLGDEFRKDEHIERDAGPLLVVPNKTYLVMRRFSAKEEPRRITCAVLRQGQLPGNVIGLENHLNFVHRPNGDLIDDEAAGLCAILNSATMDRFFRISSGNTQVSATEVRAMPLPLLEHTREIGRLISAGKPAETAIAGVLDGEDRGSEGDTRSLGDAHEAAKRDERVHAPRVRRRGAG